MIADHLENKLEGFVLYRNLLLGRMRPPKIDETTGEDIIPEELITVLVNGGAAPTPCRGTQTFEYQDPVQVRIRSRKLDFKGGQELAFLVRDALKSFPGSTWTGVAGCLPQQTNPVYLGPDNAEREEWSINLLVFGGP